MISLGESWKRLICISSVLRFGILWGVSSLVISEVVQTIADQLKQLNPLFQVEFNIKSLIAMSDDRLRLHSRHRGGVVVNIDIQYDRGADLYNIEAYKLTKSALNCEEVFSGSGFFAEQLDETLNEILKDYL